MYINVDNGGTFTDFWAFDAARSFRVKARTTPHDLSECLFEGLRLLAEEIYHTPADLSRLLAETKFIRYSTTQGTNALVQRKGPRIGVVLAPGTGGAALRGTGEVESMFDVLVGSRVESFDLSLLERSESEQDAASGEVMRSINALTANGANRIVVSFGSSEMEHKFRRLAGQRFPQHLLGTVPLLLTTDLTADRDFVRSTWTAILNAFLHPAIEKFLYNTDHRLKDMNLRAPLLIFRNDGLAGRIAKTSAIKTYGSGPEGGVRGAEALARAYNIKHLVTLDAGGTTTDFAIVEKGRALRKAYGNLEIVPVSIPMSDFRSVGIGGGSIIRVKDGLINVGPESVGSAPGPACFGFGGTQATFTDVKLFKGVIDPNRYFGGRLCLDPARARSAIEANVGVPLGLDADAAADAMENAWVQAVAVYLRKYVTPNSVLGAFGGAGPFSICAIADAVRVRKVLVPAMSAVFSAYGIGESGIGHRYELSLTEKLSAREFAEKIDALLNRARADIFAEGFDLDSCTKTWSLIDQRGTETIVSAGGLPERLVGLPAGTQAILELVVAKRVDSGQRIAAQKQTLPEAHATRTARLSGSSFERLPLYFLEDLKPGRKGKGPAIIEDDYFTLPVLKGWSFNISERGDIELARD